MGESVGLLFLQQNFIGVRTRHSFESYNDGLLTLAAADTSPPNVIATTLYGHLRSQGFQPTACSSK